MNANWKLKTLELKAGQAFNEIGNFIAVAIYPIASFTFNSIRGH
jgi:O-acetylhomoserine/O-acetylserine sulfhydrylase-like pyridoxal-dependent enzyme